MRKICIAVLLILICAAVAVAAIAVVQHKAIAGNGTTAQTTPGVNTSGSDLFVECAASGATPTLNDGQNAQGTYSPLSVRGTSPSLVCQYKKSPTTNSGTQWSASDAGNFPAIAALALSGTVTASSPFDAEDGDTGSSATSATGLSIATSASNNVAVLACAFDTTVSSITVSGYTNADTVAFSFGTNWGLTLWYKFGVSNPEAPVPSWTGSAGYRCNLFDFKNPAPAVVERRTLDISRIGTRQVH